jgi:hypothetical protein
MRSLLASAASVAVLAVTSMALAGPAAAQSGVVYDGDDPGPGYTPLEALALFVGIPALSIIIIVIAVYAPGWVKGRSGAGEVVAAGEPVWLSSPAGTMSAPSGPGMITPGGPTDHEERGGASARW